MGLSRRLFLTLAGLAGGSPAIAAESAPDNDALILPTLADLQRLAPAGLQDGAARRVLGYHRAGDGGGGWFRWDAAAEAAPDLGTVFSPAADPKTGRWLRIVEGDWQVKWFGVRADGTSDDGPALERAINASAGRALLLPKGVLRIGAPLSVRVPSYCLRGQQPERAQYGRNNGTILDASAIGRDKWLVERFDASPPLEDTIGPFVHENLDIRLGETNGFAFGRADLDRGSLERADYDGVVDRAGQKYVHGVQFAGCRITGGIARHGSDERGRISRTGQRLILLTKCFESRIENCSLVGGDVQVETWGCDAPLIRHVRSNNSHVPVLLQRSGWFGVSHRVAELQCESFTFGGVVSDGVMLEASNLRFEPNVAGNLRGVGRYDLTEALGVTARVAAGEDTILASQDMTGILFPGLSLVELSDGAGRSDLCLVTGVDGQRVASWSEGFTFTRSAEAARLVRVHGYGVMHGGAHDATIVGGHPDAFRDCPSFVYRAENGSMYLAAIGKVPGSNGDVRSRVLGNVYKRATAPVRQMAFSACSPSVVADPVHPFVTGLGATPAQRSGWSPRNHAAVGVPFTIVAGPPGGPERLPAWLLRPGTPLLLPSPSVQEAGQPVMLARAVEGPTALRVRRGSASLDIPVNDAWSSTVLPAMPSPAADIEIAADRPALVASLTFSGAA